MSIPQGSPLLESGCKSTRFSDTLQIYSTIFLRFFGKEKINRWNITKWRDIFFKEWTGRGKRLEGKAHYYIHACVCVCAKGKKKEEGRTDIHRSFSYFPLSPITCNHKRPCSSGFKAWWQVAVNLSPHLSPITRLSPNDRWWVKKHKQ